MTVNVYHKHSVVKDKAPDRSQLELGEIGICCNQDSPALYIKDSADNIVEVTANSELEELEERVEKIEQLIESLPTDDQIKKWDDLNKEVAQLRIDLDKNTLDIANLTGRVETLEQDVENLKKELLEIKIDVAKNKTFIENLNIAEGDGIEITHVQNTSKWKVEVDKVWLAAVVDAAITEALKPYALIDFGTHTDDLP